MDKRPLAVISVFFILGIVLGRFLPDSVTLFQVFVVTLILIALTLTLSHKWERGLFWVFLKGKGRGGFASHRGAGYPGARHRGETRPYSSDNSRSPGLNLGYGYGAEGDKYSVDGGRGCSCSPGLNLAYGVDVSGGKGKVAHIFLFLSIISVGALLYLNSNIFPPNHISHFSGKDKLKAEITSVIKVDFY